ncbi:MAG TPA: 30S ribosomal protein S4 [Anaerolineales bacterium]|nr:30S ribosomal protein S4 [Anaerolineales bacterium]HMV95406.1 30S ribosomal protein S4 [Anaerolineales bacterium]HMX18177.1 30S ribosomal protein S4 [Anaerolineales bacterium]HMX72742.1 30S ribosomal protein S4 [Anaerolineales bacterium]HMZ42683.1 30S ribosomal protein S4 [Anaerolineales bacterium]
MAKTLSPVCKLCRREGEKLFLKGERCFTPKCSFEKRDFAPGQHGRTAGRGGGKGKGMGTGRASDFARQLRAKQKARRIYGVMERQFRRYYDTAKSGQSLTGLTLLQILESRLDNVVFRLGFASSRSQARLLVAHGHFKVNGRRTDVPSMLLSEGDVVSVREGSSKLTYFKDLSAYTEKRTAPSWLNRDIKAMAGTLARMPERAEIDGSLDEQLIVEYYSRR